MSFMPFPFVSKTETSLAMYFEDLQVTLIHFYIFFSFSVTQFQERVHSNETVLLLQAVLRKNARIRFIVALLIQAAKNI